MTIFWFFFLSQPCEAPKNKYDYGSDGCRGCDCVSSVTCPQLNCMCPDGMKRDTDINGCLNCQCIPGKPYPHKTQLWAKILCHFHTTLSYCNSKLNSWYDRKVYSIWADLIYLRFKIAHLNIHEVHVPHPSKIALGTRVWEPKELKG